MGMARTPSMACRSPPPLAARSSSPLPWPVSLFVMPINCLQPSPSPSSLCSLGLPLGGFSWKWIAFSLVQWYQKKIDDFQHNNGNRYYKWCYLVNNGRKSNNALPCNMINGMRAERFKLELKFLILNMNLQIIIFFKDFLLSIQIIRYIYVIINLFKLSFD